MQIIHSLPLFTLLYAIGTFLLLLIAYSLAKYIIKPLLGIAYYKKQGGVSIFHWQLISYMPNYKNAVEKGDFYYTYKEIVKKNPKARFIIENFGPDTVLILIDTEMAKEVLRKYEIYQKDKRFIELLLDVCGGTIILAEGHVWKKGRKIVSSAFNFEFLKNLVPMIVETTQEKFDDWIKNQELVETNLLDKLATITGEVTGKFFFGRRFGGQTIRGMSMTAMAQKIGNDVVQDSMSFTSLVFGAKLARKNILPRHKELNRNIAELRGRCRQMIQETEKSQKKEDNLLGLLLESRKSEKEEDRLTDEQIVGEFVGIFEAGTDTTAHLINSTLYFLWKYPEVFKKVKEEIDREFKDPKSVNIETLNRMEYTTAVLKEALRLGGPAVAVFTRMAMKDDNLCGVHIKKGTLVEFYFNLCFHSEKYFSRPDEFIPERWLPNSPFSNDGVNSDPYAYIPFSAGPRNCIGQHLAMIQSKIVIGMFLRTFKFDFPKNEKVIFVPRFVNEPLDPLLITLEPIQNS